MSSQDISSDTDRGSFPVRSKSPDAAHVLVGSLWRLAGTQTKLILEINLISARQCLINVAAVKKILDFPLSA